MVQVPPVVRNKAEAAGVSEWVDDLPSLIAALEQEWSFKTGEAFNDSTEALVAAVERDDGTPAVLKLLIPRDGDQTTNEITVLRLAEGDGCPVLYEADTERHALLVERLGPSMYEMDIPIRKRHEMLCVASQGIWRPAPGADLPNGADKGRWLIEYILTLWEELDFPCSERVISHAIACAERRIDAHNEEQAVLVHGDVHQWNALQAGDAFKLVDPDGLVAEPEYDLGIIMREDPVELVEGDPRDRAHRLAALTGTDARAIWEWGVVERVSTGLLGTRIDLQPVGRQMLAAAEHVASQGE